MARKLTRRFFTRDALTVSRRLLGKYLVVRTGAATLAGKIVEVEAYPGPFDRASHAFRGKRTPRNEAEFNVGGHVYTYMVYGMHWQLNISTGERGYPECVLIRALEVPDDDARAAAGPGKLCSWLGIDRSFYGEDVTISPRIWLEDRGVRLAPELLARGPRIGIDYAGPYYARKPWRSWIAGNPGVSRT